MIGTAKAALHPVAPLPEAARSDLSPNKAPAKAIEPRVPEAHPPMPTRPIEMGGSWWSQLSKVRGSFLDYLAEANTKGKVVHLHPAPFQHKYFVSDPLLVRKILIE